ncbi:MULTISPECIES: hydantoinase B/oxoprolinase family protein [unclassified Pseudofrankia]|uniref:hydantoinase B/oxoprolinase family protein n=1 Tax=unclassified Pseudofrankia TaxID=2994372 RepID=UPI0008D9684F|nr:MULTISPECIES: hydantoinase B/oxoprolinase family protein [unclassified Pseudofrankia]MDT3444685.1 hydantoinase B/oxoprolinase family protein [Pseudofrankia sp. BMG5.37]OHV66576.1 methylhydantoinase [Pseudofrankia sp. BMG5.36]
MTTTSVALRDLKDEQFQESYGCDRFTASVLSNRLRYICGHMATGLLHKAFSPIISYMSDFATAVVGPPELDYPMPAVNNGLALFLGTLSDAVRNTVEEYGPENLRVGDLLIANDPNRAGCHVNDLMFVAPAFFENRISGFIVIRAHQLDMGGSVPGGFGAKKTDSYENGLVLPPILLYSQGTPVRSTFSLIFDNARWGQLLLPDIRTINESCALGLSMFRESVERYGRAAMLGSMRFATDRSAEEIADALASVADGDYTGTAILDADNATDEQYDVVVKVIKRGARVEVDLSGSSRQAQTCINAGALDAKTAVGVGLNMATGVRSPFTSGSFRHIDVVIPPGTVASALPPDGAIFFYWEVSSAILAAIIVALKDVLGDRSIGGDYGSTSTHNAQGTRGDGTTWQSLSECGGEWGAWGASREGDGDGYNALYFVNTMSPATEGIEASVPVVIARKEYVPDTGGPGRHRGGSGTIKDVRYLDDAEHYTTPLRFKAPSGTGVNGGDAGRMGGVWILDQEGTADIAFPGIEDSSYLGSTALAGVVHPDTRLPTPDGVYAYFGRVATWKTGPGAMFRYRTNGGGGWGAALTRDPERVARDVRDEYVSIAGAARDYGVVVVGDPQTDPEGVKVDVRATAALRAELEAGTTRLS